MSHPTTTKILAIAKIGGRWGIAITEMSKELAEKAAEVDALTEGISAVVDPMVKAKAVQVGFAGAASITQEIQRTSAIARAIRGSGLDATIAAFNCAKAAANNAIIEQAAIITNPEILVGSKPRK